MSTHEQTMKRFDQLEEMLVRALRDQIALSRELVALLAKSGVDPAEAAALASRLNVVGAAEKKAADVPLPL